MTFLFWKLSLIVTLLLQIQISLITCQYSQSAVLYPLADIEGPSSPLIETYIDDLSTLDFDNRAVSVCIFGIWIFYDLPHYNPTDSYVEYAFGSYPYGFCFNFGNMTQRTSSLSYVGSVTDYRADRLTLFVSTDFQGVDERISVDKPTLNLDRQTVSIIVTGASPWTLYDNQNYAGESVCVYPPQSTDYSPAFIYDTRTIDVPHRTIRSVRKGCFGGRVVVTTKNRHRSFIHN